MAATGLDLTRLSRRGFLFFCAVAVQGADDPPTLKLLTQFASRISDGNLPGSIEVFSKAMPGYQDLVANIGAIVSQYDVICDIEIRDESGDEAHRKAETEWFVQLRSKQENGPTERRTVVVQIETARIAGKWRITGIAPQTILAPPQIR